MFTYDLTPTAARITAEATARDYVTNASHKVAPGPCKCGPVVELNGRKLRLCKVEGVARHLYIPASKIEETK